MILNCVVRAPREGFTQHSPAVAQSPMQNEEYPLLVLRPGGFIYVWAEVVVPSFPALFANPPGEKRSDVRPLFSTVFFY